MSACMCKLTIISFYEPPEYKLYRCVALSPLYSPVFSPNKNTLQHNHHTTLQVTISTLMQHYHLTYRSCSKAAPCSNWWVLTALRTGSEFCYHVSFNLDFFFSHLFYILDHFMILNVLLSLSYGPEYNLP